MTIDKSLKVKSGMIKVRNVLTRGERLEKLKEMEKFSAGTSPLGLPKVRAAFRLRWSVGDHVLPR